MSDEIKKLNCKILTFWLSFKLKKVYLECETTHHLVKNEDDVLERGSRVKLIYSIEDIDKANSELFSKINHLFPKITAEINLNSFKTVKSDGFSYSAYTASSLTCLES